jgi:hypothetical protein
MERGVLSAPEPHIATTSLLVGSVIRNLHVRKQMIKYFIDWDRYTGYQAFQIPEGDPEELSKHYPTVDLTEAEAQELEDHKKKGYEYQWRWKAIDEAYFKPTS